MIILLDIDGVMVPAHNWKSPEILGDGFLAFSKTAIEALQDIISNQTAVVLTTTHRFKYTVAEWREIFKTRGIVVDDIRLLEANFQGLNRKDEILEWMTFHSVTEDFAILDDDKSLNDLPVDLKSHLVLTSPLIGLTREHVKRIHESGKMTPETA